MRNRIIARLEELMLDSDEGLERPESDGTEFITEISEFENMQDDELLDFFEFTVGFQG